MNGNIKFDIFRKKTQTDTVIPYDSNHHFSHKNAAFYAYLHRAFYTPLNEEDRNREINIIKNIASNNGYPTDFVPRLIRRIKNKNHQQVTSLHAGMTTIESYRSIKYPGITANKIRKIFRKYNTQISFKTNNSIYQILNNNKDKTDILKRSGVYQLECHTCNATYIGETGRNIQQRIKEHQMNINSNFGRHILTSSHNFEPDTGVKLLHKMNKGTKMMLYEAYEIDKFKTLNKHKTCLNDQVQLQKITTI